MATSGALMAALLILTEQGVNAKYHRYDYEAACGPFVYQVRFRNGPEERGLVEHVLIDGRPVPGAAALLELRAARRWIARIEIVDCGMDARQPVFRGLLVMSEMDSLAAHMRPMLAFRIRREGREGWKLSID